MTEKIGIEFDQEIFPNKSDCTHWLRQRPEYESFLENKKFELKSCQRSDFMSTEPRKVWHWKKLAKFSHFATERPDNYVLVIKSMPGPYHYPSQMPPPTAKFQAAEQKKNFQLQEREFKQRKKYEANRNKRKLSYTFHYTNFFKRGTDYKIRPTPGREIKDKRNRK